MGVLESILGLNADELNAGQMAVRAVLTFAVTVAIVRMGHKRLFGKATAFDLVVAIMVGSVMSRAITHTYGLFAVWLAGLVLIVLHGLMAALAYRFHRFGPVVKGRPSLLVEDGKVHQDAMRAGHVSRFDLDQAIREAGDEPDPSQVRLAYLERDGSISVVPRKGQPRILEVAVENNVQVVRIALE